MKWLSKEPFSFNNDDYKNRAKNMSAHALWERQCKKSRTKVSSSAGIGFSSIMLIPTMGTSTLGLVTNGRTLDIARRKRKVINAEAHCRNLPDYEKTKRDLLIPLGVSLTVFATVGLLDVLFFAGTSSAILNDVAEKTLPAMMHDPSHFFLSVWHRTEFQVQQIFHSGPQILALGSDPGHVVAGAGGLDPVNGSTPNPTNASTVAAAATSFKAHSAEHVHSLATPATSSKATPILVADKSIGAAAASHANSGIPSELSGANMGVSFMENVEKYAVRYAIADTGLVDIPAKNLEVNNDANTTASDSRLRIPNSVGEDARLAQAAVLTGESSRSFQFLSKEYRPVSQWVMIRKESCTHDSKKYLATKKCAFCLQAIDPQIQAYYHCCLCSGDGELTNPSYDLCEVCVAGRGCSCPYREDHIIHRKGLLTEKIFCGGLIE